MRTKNRAKSLEMKPSDESSAPSPRRHVSMVETNSSDSSNRLVLSPSIVDPLSDGLDETTDTSLNRSDGLVLESAEGYVADTD